MRMTVWAILLFGSLTIAGCSQQETTDELVGDLASEDDEDRVRAARLLQNRSADAAKIVPALIKSLGDVEADVRRSAAIGLGYYGAKAKEAVPALEEKQNDPDARVREAAKTAISRINNQTSK